MVPLSVSIYAREKRILCEEKCFDMTSFMYNTYKQLYKFPITSQNNHLFLFDWFVLQGENNKETQQEGNQ